MTDCNNSEILIYQSENGVTKIDVKIVDDTVWLTQEQLCELYQTSKSNVSEHIKHIFEDGELDRSSVIRKFRTTGTDGKTYNVIHYNLDMIISLGYRIKSIIATNFRRWATERLKEYMIKGFTMDDERLKQLGGGNYWKELLDRIRDILATNFRRWATERLKEYMIKGFTMDDERLKQLGGGNYWKELLDRIRDIHSSEKVMYRQVLDLYATSVDYNPKSSESIAFFKMVQNKLHFVAHGHVLQCGTLYGCS